MPRPLWARLITACLGAVRVDSTLVVETVGIPNMCEHAPSTVIWACLADTAARELGDSSLAMPVPAAVAAPVGVVPRSARARAGPEPVIVAAEPTALPFRYRAARLGTLAGLTTPPSGTRVPVTAGGVGRAVDPRQRHARRRSRSRRRRPRASPSRRRAPPRRHRRRRSPPPSPVASPPTLDMLDDLDDPIAPPPVPPAGCPPARQLAPAAAAGRRPAAARATAHTTSSPAAGAGARPRRRRRRRAATRPSSATTTSRPTSAPRTSSARRVATTSSSGRRTKRPGRQQRRRRPQAVGGFACTDRARTARARRLRLYGSRSHARAR